MINQEHHTTITLQQEKGVAVNKGQCREKNEDSVAAINVALIDGDMARTVGIYAVADGMGGEPQGEIASSMAIHITVQEIINRITDNEDAVSPQYQQWLTEAVSISNLAVYKDHQGMGSTLVIALVVENQAYIANVGDSRAYVITAKGVQQITEDQSYVQNLLNAGAITYEQAENHPYRNILTQSIGGEAEVKVDLYTTNLVDGNYLLLCSDGLTNELTDDRIYRIIRRAQSPQYACDALIDAANASGGHDNIAVVLVHFKSDES